MSPYTISFEQDPCYTRPLAQQNQTASCSDLYRADARRIIGEESTALYVAELAMPEPESAVLIKKLRRANRLWKVAAISLALVLTMLVVNIFWEVHLAEAETYRLQAEAERIEAAVHMARQEVDKQREKALQEFEKALEKARRQ